MYNNNTELQLHALSSLIYATADFEYYYKAYMERASKSNRSGYDVFNIWIHSGDKQNTNIFCRFRSYLFRFIFFYYLFVKNVLNEFRQKNGYKNGTYKKIWKVDIGEGIKEYEDNEVVFAIANKIPLEEIDTSFIMKLKKSIKN